MKPMIKYRGGKYKEIDSFKEYIPSEFNTYFEPFFGGGAVYFYLEPQNAIINDVNERVVQFYKEMQLKYDVARRELNELQELYERNQQEYLILKEQSPEKKVENKNEELYYKIRDMFNHTVPEEYLDSVVYYFINKTAYSGMIRYNAKGEYNVPFGRYQHFNTNLITLDHIGLLQRTKIECGDYKRIFDMAQEDDFMFLDPPYDCIFNDYGNVEFKNGFDEEEHRRLANDFRKLKCKALMVIGKTDLTMELYGDLVKDEYFKSYAVNIRNRFKSESKHIIVTNY